MLTKMSSSIGPMRVKRKYNEINPSFQSKPPTSTLIDSKYAKSDPQEFEIIKKSKTVPFQVLPPKRDVITVILDANNHISNGDKQLCWSCLREFSTDHLPTLDKQLHERCLEILLNIAKVSKIGDIGRLALRMSHSILEKTDDNIITKVLPIILAGKERDGKSLSRHSFLDGSILSLMEMFIRRGIIAEWGIFPSWIESTLKRADHDMHNPIKRREAIKFRSALAVFNVSGAESTGSIQSFVCDATRDRDVRVRISALEGLREIGQLQVEHYSVVKELCRDSQASVRMSSLRLIHRFAQSFPHHEIVVPSSSSSIISSRICLSDDAFCAVCHAVNDMEVEVRCLASSLLGEFDVVSESYLDQTLDKKLMKMKKTEKGAIIGVRTNQSLFSIRKMDKKKDNSEWSSGKELNEIAPGEKGRMGKDEESIMPQGACGAFISALEDEFMGVRKAAVYSLGKLASTRPSLAAAALDHLADMFNDEIEEVRLDSITALTPLVSRGELYKEQLETIIKCLDDATPVSRGALRRLLEKTNFADIECIRICVKSLLLCMKRYPMDKNDIFETMGSLGRCHSSLVHPLVTELLNIHPIFASQEKSLQDDQYMAKLVMVLNAASQFEPLISLLPPYVLRHFRYMRCAIPHLVPHIPAMESGEKGVAERHLSELRDKWTGGKGQLLEEVYSRLVEIQKTKESNTRIKLRKYIVEDLEAISSFNISLASPSRLLISIVYLLNSMDRSPLESINVTGDANEIHESIDKELWGLECIEDGISSLPSPIISFLVETKVHVIVFRWMTSLLLRPLSYKSVMEQMRTEIDNIQSRFMDSSLVQSTSCKSLVDGLLYLLGSGKVISHQMLNDLILNNPPSLPTSIDNIEKVKVKWAKIIEPEKDVLMERPHRFVSLLPTCTHFVADIHELDEDDRERIRIKIEYPDGSITLFRPRKKEMNEMEDNIIRLRSNVLVAVSSSWSDAADVTLSIVLLPSSSSSSRSIPLSSSPSSSLPSSVTIKIQPMVNAGGHQNPSLMGPGAMPM